MRAALWETATGRPRGDGLNLDAQEAQSIEQRVRDVESRTGAQVVAGVLGRAAAYPEIAWKAFALASGAAAVAVVITDSLRPNWIGSHVVVLTLVPVLLAGVLSALATMFVPGYARRYVPHDQAHAQVRQRAHALFLDRRLTDTRDRIGVLLLVSLFERRIEIVADCGYDGKVSAADWNRVIRAMMPALRQRRHVPALLQGLEVLETLLRERGYAHGSARDELANRPIDETTA